MAPWHGNPSSERTSELRERAYRKVVRTVFSKKLPAFTLVELIVVITILAILATVWFLSLSGYSDDARTATVKANVRTVYSAILTESTTTGNSPRHYVDHSTGAALSGATAYLEGSQVVLSGGQYGDPGTNYSAGNPRWDRLRMNGDKFKLALERFGIPALGTSALKLLAPDTSAAYSTGELSVWAVDAFKTVANGRKRNVPFFQVAAVVPWSKTVVVSGNYPAWAGIQGLVRNPDSQWPYDALADGVRNYYPGCDTADIILPNGQRWAACNVGAFNAWTWGVSFANTGATNQPNDYNALIRNTLGHYFQWGRNTEVTTLPAAPGPVTIAGPNFYTGSVSPYSWSPLNDDLWGGSGTTTSTGTFSSLGSPAAMRGPCADGYHVPTQKEWCDAIIAVSPNDPTCISKFYAEANVNKFRDTLLLPLAGNRDFLTAAFSDQGSLGYYWASTLDGRYGLGVRLSPTLGVYRQDYKWRAYGFSVRCLAN